MYLIPFRKLSLASCVLICATLATTSSSAQQAVWPLDGPSFNASVSDIRAAAAAIVPEKFAAATVLFERDSYTFDDAGRLTYNHTMIYRIEAESALQGWSEIDVRYDPWHEGTPSIHARVIGPDGQASELDQKTVTDGPASEQDQATFTDARIHKAPLPNIRVGSIVEEQTSNADTQPFFAAGSVYRNVLSRPVPVVRAQLLVTVPKAANLQYRVHNLPAVKIDNSETGSLRTLKFDQPYQTGRVGSDINLPTHEIDIPMVDFSTGASWAAIASGYRQLAEPQIDPAKVKGMVPASKGATRLARIGQIVAWLHKEIRYTGVEFGQASLQPRTATEVLERHFGDCKDKAAFLVALLRADGIPAQMALLNAGTGIDVSPDLPGMSQFNHAIVYVPATAKGNDDLWIDATDDFASVGTLPLMDQGRLALIIADGATGLTQIPINKPEENLLTEMREVTMADSGPARISETSLTKGPVDADYRRDFGSGDSRQLRTNLEAYAKNYYLAQALASVDHGDAKDFQKPFALKLVMDKSRRAVTSNDDADVAIPYGSLFERLPAWFRTDPETKGTELTPQQQEDRKRAEAVRASTYDMFPIVTEWHYTITPAEGYQPRTLPDNKEQQMGPAKLTIRFSAAASGSVTAVFRFESPKSQFTQAEALALRDAILAIYKQDAVVLVFDQVGAKLMAAGKMREALAADRALIAAHPQQAVEHAHFAYALLKAGLGEMARAEAKQATTLDPSSAMAFKTLGWMCEFNKIGVHWGYGSDRDCAEQALGRGAELDPDDLGNRVDLAIAHEYDTSSERYTPGAHLDQAIKIYKEVADKDKSMGDQYENYLLFDLLFANRYSDLLDETAKVSSSPVRNGLAIAAVVAQQRGDAGIAAGLARAERLSGSAQDRSAALLAAGDHLEYMRMYPEAAAILTAATEGQTNSAQLTQRIRSIRQKTPWNGEYLPASDPRSVVQRLRIEWQKGTFSPQIAESVLSPHSYFNDAERQERIKGLVRPGYLHVMAGDAGVPGPVVLDDIVGNVKITAEGDDQKGHIVTWQKTGNSAYQYFVTSDDGRFMVASDGYRYPDPGNQALYLLDAGRNDEARALLDWLRGRIHKGSGDDPLAGPLFPFFWTAGQKADPASMRLAAISLLAFSSGIRPHIDEIHTAWKNSTSEEERARLGLVAANGYSFMGEGAGLTEVATDLLKIYPDSERALSLAAHGHALLKDWAGMRKILDDAIARHPDSDSLLRIKSFALQDQEDFAGTRATIQKIVEMGKATSDDYNNYAWSALFDGKVDADAVRFAEQSVQMHNNSNYSDMHTLACVYAFQGRTTEAQDMILKAMGEEDEPEPSSTSWLAWGLIYEKYGVLDAAADAYRRVEKPAVPSTTSSWQLAQLRLKAMAAPAAK